MSCGGGKTDGVHQLQPLFSLLNRCIGVVARTARTTVTAVAATVTVAPETAFAVATEAATTTVIAIAVAIGLAHHGRRAFLVFLDANTEIADHVFADPLLPLDFGDRRRRAVDVQQHEMCLAI